MSALHPRRSAEAGYSLIELLVSSAVMLTVTGAIFGMMAPASGSSHAQTEVADLQQRMRIGSDVLFKELMMAGAGVYQGTNSGSLINFFAPILPRRLTDSAATASANVITLTYIPNSYAQTTISQPMPPQSAELKVVDQANCPDGEQLCGFKVGMVVLIFDNLGHFDLFELTQVQDSAGHLQHRGQDLSFKYETGANVTQSVSNTYYRDAATNQLKRFNNGLADVPLVDNVVDLQISYFGIPKIPKPPVGQGNCLYDTSGLPVMSEMPVLPSSDGSLAALPLAMLKDGPFCGSGDTRYDVDLLRVRKVRIMLRMQVGSVALRGKNVPGQPQLWVNEGTSREAAKSVPDYTVTFEVAPRNLNLGR